MKILGVLGLFGSLSAYAITTPANDIYSDSLTIERASAEVPDSLEASNLGATPGPSDASVDLDTAATADIQDDEALESASQVVKAAKPKAKKTARNKSR
jgi:hypothetical protein